MEKIPLTKPYITDEIKAKVCEVLDSGYITEGNVTGGLEQAFQEYIGCEYAIATTSCTTGLEMALRTLGIGPGDEVIVPDYTYPATADVVQIVGAKIIIVDIDQETMLIDYDHLEQAITPNTKVVIPVSLFGNPLDYDRLKNIKEKYHIYIVEDAACSIGAEYKDTKVGCFADISVFSLHPRKFITTGEGGIITTNNTKWAEWVISYKHFGIGVKDSGLTKSFEMIGSNYKLSDILAAVGLVQMHHIDELIAKRRAQAQNYINLFRDHPRFDLPITTPSGTHSYQSFCVFVENRDELLNKLRENGIEVQIGTYSLHMHRAFQGNQNCKIMADMTGSRYAFHHCMTLPLYHDMTEEEQQYIIHQLLNGLQ